jgi:hypothetical protein
VKAKQKPPVAVALFIAKARGEGFLGQQHKRYAPALAVILLSAHFSVRAFLNALFIAKARLKVPEAPCGGDV